MLQLHVWGAGLGLPSIDPECLAIIAYLHHAGLSADWCLVPSSDVCVGPSHHLPALHDDGVWTSGYRQIVSYLASRSLCKNLDSGLEAGQQADVAAYSAYLSAHAAPLVDLSLYVSAANWSAVTRPAYRALLPFPLTWTVPPLRRTDAIKRAQHLGLGDLDADLDPKAALHLAPGHGALPETFRRHLPAMRSRMVRNEMTPEQAAAIRLTAVVEDCLYVLNALLAPEKKDGIPPRCFPSTSVCSLDCLAYGYLALMLVPTVPRPFLRDWIQTEAPCLGTFVHSMTPHHVPWTAPAPTTLRASAARIVDSVLRTVPSLGDLHAKEMRLRAQRGSRGLDRRMLMLATGFVATTVAVAYGVSTYKSISPFGSPIQVWTTVRGGSRQGQSAHIRSILGAALGARHPELVHATPALESAPGGDGSLVLMYSELD